MFQSRILAVLSLAAAVFALGGCGAGMHAAVRGSEPEAAPAQATQVPPDDALNATVWIQGTVEHDMLLAETYRIAREKLDRAVADVHWDALPTPERSGDSGKLPPAVIVDIDETVLDNSPFQARMIDVASDFDDAAWDAWCKQAAARPLPGALEFARYAAAHGVTMFYVTNRALKHKAVTEANLRKAGFPISDAEPVVFVAGDPESCAAAGTAKSCRRALIGRTHRVVMVVGDQLSDFIDLPRNTPAARAESAHDYADWFGERWFMLPNPMYGSWEGAANGGVKGATREQKRAAKRAGLRRD